MKESSLSVHPRRRLLDYPPLGLQPSRQTLHLPREAYAESQENLDPLVVALSSSTITSMDAAELDRRFVEKYARSRVDPPDKLTHSQDDYSQPGFYLTLP